MRLTNKTERFDMGETWVGRKKNYDVSINSHREIRSMTTQYWYFVLSKDRKTYNSLWDNIRYNSKEECTEGAEKKIEELLKAAK